MKRILLLAASTGCACERQHGLQADQNGVVGCVDSSSGLACEATCFVFTS